MSSFQPDAQYRCACGYDLLRPSGAERDAAHCEVCSWQAGGVWAEHAGTHHWIDTGHHWRLVLQKGNR